MPAKKTERYDNSVRVVPILPELLPILEKAYLEATDGTERVVTMSERQSVLP